MVHWLFFVGMVLYLVVGVLVVAAAGYVLGYVFRKGWDRAGTARGPGPSGPS